MAAFRLTTYRLKRVSDIFGSLASRRSARRQTTCRGPDIAERFAASSWRHRRCGAAGAASRTRPRRRIAAGFDLDKGQMPPVRGDQIDFAGRRPKAPGEDLIAAPWRAFRRLRPPRPALPDRLEPARFIAVMVMSAAEIQAQYHRPASEVHAMFFSLLQQRPAGSPLHGVADRLAQLLFVGRAVRAAANQQHELAPPSRSAKIARRGKVTRKISSKRLVSSRAITSSRPANDVQAVASDLVRRFAVSKKMSVPGMSASSSRRRFAAASRGGRKPAKKKLSVGRPLDGKAGNHGGRSGNGEDRAALRAGLAHQLVARIGNKRRAGVRNQRDARAIGQHLQRSSGVRAPHYVRDTGRAWRSSDNGASASRLCLVSSQQTYRRVPARRARAG